MAGIGKASDFVIYQEQFWGGMSEVLEQNANAFNAAGNNTILLVPNRLRGEYRKNSFFKIVDSLVTRRDTTSVDAAADLGLAQGELVSVKLNRKIGPVAQTLDAFRKIGMGAEEMSFVLGQQMGQAVAIEMIDTSLGALDAAITAQTALNFDATGLSTKTLTHTYLVDGLSKFGDAAAKIVAWVMHSKPYFDLMKQAIADKIFEVAGVTIYQGTVATLGRPVVVLDSSALHAENGSLTDTYNILGLTEGSAVVEESEQREIVSDTITGLENLVIRIQGEYAYNLGLKGFAWKVATGANPTDAAVLTGSNWTKVVTEAKATSGVRIKVQ